MAVRGHLGDTPWPPKPSKGTGPDLPHFRPTVDQVRRCPHLGPEFRAVSRWRLLSFLLAAVLAAVAARALYPSPMTYLMWSYFPRNVRQPAWASSFVEVVKSAESKISTVEHKTGVPGCP
jgi:hypothetical protein